MELNISAAALDAFIANKERIKQPSSIDGGSRLVDQNLASMFKEKGSLQVKLVKFTVTELPTNRTRTNPTSNITTVISDNMQQRGKATILVNGQEYENVAMHFPTMLAFADKGDTLVLNGSVGEITMGQNTGKMWLSLSYKGEYSVETGLKTVQSKILDLAAA